jgi:hypothetical protein
LTETSGVCIIKFMTETDVMMAAGAEARAASLDAHGELVAVEEAYDFIRTVWYDTEDERYNLLPEHHRIEFVVAYYDDAE